MKCSGHCSRTCLLESPYKEWFVKNYSEYSVDSNTANKLVPLLKNKTIVVFMGTGVVIPGEKFRDSSRSWIFADSQMKH
jgi:hypothetical protein